MMKYLRSIIHTVIRFYDRFKKTTMGIGVLALVTFISSVGDLGDAIALFKSCSGSDKEDPVVLSIISNIQLDNYEQKVEYKKIYDDSDTIFVITGLEVDSLQYEKKVGLYLVPLPLSLTRTGNEYIDHIAFSIKSSPYFKAKKVVDGELYGLPEGRFARIDGGLSLFESLESNDDFRITHEEHKIDKNIIVGNFNNENDGAIDTVALYITIEQNGRTPKHYTIINLFFAIKDVNSFTLNDADWRFLNRDIVKRALHSRTVFFCRCSPEETVSCLKDEGYVDVTQYAYHFADTKAISNRPSILSNLLFWAVVVCVILTVALAFMFYKSIDNTIKQVRDKTGKSNCHHLFLVNLEKGYLILLLIFMVVLIYLIYHLSWMIFVEHYSLTLS